MLQLPGGDAQLLAYFLGNYDTAELVDVSDNAGGFHIITIPFLCRRVWIKTNLF